MIGLNIIWLPNVRNKLVGFRSDRFTPEETLDFISSLILETEELLLNPVLGKTYIEETGDYKGVSRIVIRRFRIYYELVRDDIIILAILFPGEK